jgi:hypothetical protein
LRCDDAAVDEPLPLIECPYCRESVRPILLVYGFQSVEVLYAAFRGEVRFADMVAGPESPDYVCPACDRGLPWTEEGLRMRAMPPV